MPSANQLRSNFGCMMSFFGWFWAYTVALMVTVPAAAGRYKSLLPPEPAGEHQEADAWLRWKTVTGEPWQIEAKRSSWHFQIAVRYRFDGETPVLVEVSRYDLQLFFYALPMAALSLLAIWMSGRRNG